MKLLIWSMFVSLNSPSFYSAIS